MQDTGNSTQRVDYSSHRRKAATSKVTLTGSACMKQEGSGLRRPTC